MCPSDTTPDPRGMMRAPEEPQFLQPRPRAARQPGDLAAGGAPGATAADSAPADSGLHDRARSNADAQDPAQRPPLPERPKQMAVDIEDEDADPVGSDQPSLRERLQGDSELRRG